MENSIEFKKHTLVRVLSSLRCQVRYRQAFGDVCRDFGSANERCKFMVQIVKAGNDKYRIIDYFWRSKTWKCNTCWPQTAWCRWPKGIQTEEVMEWVWKHAMTRMVSCNYWQGPGSLVARVAVSPECRCVSLKGTFLDDVRK